MEPRWHRSGSEVEPRWNRNDHALIVAIVHAFQLPMVLSMLQHAWSPKAERSEKENEGSDRRPSSTELTMLMAGRNP